jgi:hypothetical protein
LKLSN